MVLDQSLVMVNTILVIATTKETCHNSGVQLLPRTCLRVHKPDTSSWIGHLSYYEKISSRNIVSVPIAFCRHKTRTHCGFESP